MQIMTDLNVGSTTPTVDPSTSLPMAPDSMESKLEGQMFDQLVSQSMTEMQKRQAEIKETLEKSNDDNG